MATQKRDTELRLAILEAVAEACDNGERKIMFSDLARRVDSDVVHVEAVCQRLVEESLIQGTNTIQERTVGIQYLTLTHRGKSELSDMDERLNVLGVIG